ncbi:MAG TPA: MBL fold metallo-hydrolase, partial [bacterium]|nr:MBL fold metallo-hydrolase [bacterium]
MVSWWCSKANKIWLRVLALVVSSVFFFTQVVGASVPDRSFWRERRKARQKLLATQEKPHPSDKRKDLGKKLEEKDVAGEVSSLITPQNLFTVPSEYGTVKEVHTQGSSDKPQGMGNRLIIHIQDAHSSPEAQLNSANILKYLQKGVAKESTLPLLICVEGSSGLVDTTLLSTFPEKKIKEEVASEFLKEGKITGEEYFAITGDKKAPVVNIYGVEDKRAYEKNLKAFDEGIYSGERLRNYFRKVQEEINPLKARLYNKRLKDLESKIESYQKKKISLSQYCQYLYGFSQGNVGATLRGRPTAKYPNFELFVETSKLEEKIDFSRVDSERSEYIKELSKKLTNDELSDLLVMSLDYRLGKVTSAEYYTYLQSLSSRMGKGVRSQDPRILTELVTSKEGKNEYPNLNLYIRYNKLYDRIDQNKLFSEISELEEEVKLRLCEREEERELVKLSRMLGVLEDLVSLKVSNEDLAYYYKHHNEITPGMFSDFITRHNVGATLRGRPVGVALRGRTKESGNVGVALRGHPLGTAQSPSPTVNDVGATFMAPEITANLSKFEEFYKIALKRNQALVDNTISQMEKEGVTVAVLIAGGFHTPGITELLRERNTSYVVVTPRLGEDYSSDIEISPRKKRTDFERAIAGIVGALRPTLLLGSQASRTVFAIHLCGRTLILYSQFPPAELKEAFAELKNWKDELGAREVIEDMDFLPEVLTSGKDAFALGVAAGRNNSALPFVFQYNTVRKKFEVIYGKNKCKEFIRSGSFDNTQEVGQVVCSKLQKLWNLSDADKENIKATFGVQPQAGLTSPTFRKLAVDAAASIILSLILARYINIFMTGSGAVKEKPPVMQQARLFNRWTVVITLGISVFSLIFHYRHNIGDWLGITSKKKKKTAQLGRKQKKPLPTARTTRKTHVPISKTRSMKFEPEPVSEEQIRARIIDLAEEIEDSIIVLKKAARETVEKVAQGANIDRMTAEYGKEWEFCWDNFSQLKSKLGNMIGQDKADKILFNRQVIFDQLSPEEILTKIGKYREAITKRKSADQKRVEGKPQGGGAWWSNPTYIHYFAWLETPLVFFLGALFIPEGYQIFMPLIIGLGFWLPHLFGNRKDFFSPTVLGLTGVTYGVATFIPILGLMHPVTILAIAGLTLAHFAVNVGLVRTIFHLPDNLQKPSGFAIDLDLIGILGAFTISVVTAFAIVKGAWWVVGAGIVGLFTILGVVAWRYLSAIKEDLVALSYHFRIDSIIRSYKKAVLLMPEGSKYSTNPNEEKPDVIEPAHPDYQKNQRRIEKIKKAIEILREEGFIERADGLEKVTTILGLTDMKTSLLYSDRKRDVFRPFSPGRRRNVLYTPMKFLDNLRLDRRQDMEILAILLNQQQRFLDTYNLLSQKKVPPKEMHALLQEERRLTVDEKERSICSPDIVKARLEMLDRKDIEVLQNEIKPALRREKKANDLLRKRLKEKWRDWDGETRREEFRSDYIRLASAYGVLGHRYESLGNRWRAKTFYRRKIKTIKLIQRYEKVVWPIETQEQIVYILLQEGMYKEFLHALEVLLTGKGFPRILEKDEDLLRTQYLSLHFDFLRDEILYLLVSHESIAHWTQRRKIERIRRKAIKLFNSYEGHLYRVFETLRKKGKFVSAKEIADILNRSEEYTIKPDLRTLHYLGLVREKIIRHGRERHTLYKSVDLIPSEWEEIVEPFLQELPTRLTSEQKRYYREELLDKLKAYRDKRRRECRNASKHMHVKERRKFAEKVVVIPLGGVEGPGRSCLYVKAGYTRFILDCGQGIKETQPFMPQFDLIDEGIDFVLISHPHIDHIGSLLELIDLFGNVPIFTTEPSKEKIEVQLG